MKVKKNLFYLNRDKREFRIFKIVVEEKNHPYIVLCRYVNREDNFKYSDLSFMYSVFKEMLNVGRIINKVE